MAEFTMDDLMFKPGLMNGQRILITGGGTGLGKVMAEACLMLGAEVYIWGRRGNVIGEAAQELMDAHGGKCVGMACDIRVPEAIHDAMDQIWADGPLTGLVNNAAGNFISRTEDLSPRGFANADLSRNVGHKLLSRSPRVDVWRGSQVRQRRRRTIQFGSAAGGKSQIRRMVASGRLSSDHSRPGSWPRRASVAERATSERNTGIA